MALKRRKRKNASDGVVRALVFCCFVFIVAGAIWYAGSSEKVRLEVSALQERAVPAFRQLSETVLGRKVQPAVPSANDAEEVPALFITLPDGLEYPRCAYSRHVPDHELRRFSDYALCYRESYELAEWSAYCLERAELEKNAGRSNDFRPDPEISTGSAELSDYRGSGYDRGHLAPAADFAYSAQAMSETFYMSNMTPQAPAFNRGIWQQLEMQVRLWAKKYGRAYVATGPILSSPQESYDTIGDNAVVVPRAFYKVVLVPLYADEEDESTPETAADVASFAFIIPNEKCDAAFYDYAVSVDEVEVRTGIDFFWLLDDDIENRVEAALF
ncbi:MAG: DNA/RNA non-specific endonuclease [Treponema sp.]|nr:DNA/RNA non-specific endonuclease [Treponema sp.]